MLLTHALLDRDLVPDVLLRPAIRLRVAATLRREDPGTPAARREKNAAFAEALRRSPLAVASERANEQHYELPTDFFRLVLGRHLKYSCGYWPAWVDRLDDAEAAALALVTERAELANGQHVLELGCGWGSLTLWMAERFPRSRILAVSNSATQRAHILAEAERRGLRNVEVETADMNDFDTGRRFDRIVSVEMFEHMRNYQVLFGRLARWLAPGGKLFVHVFCHRRVAYPFEVRGDGDWMARHFFTGGVMPSADLLPRFAGALRLDADWLLDGTHYEKTANAWLARMDAHREEIMPILASVYGAAEQRRWWAYWRCFFLACAELFGYRGGREWMVAHYRFAG